MNGLVLGLKRLTEYDDVLTAANPGRVEVVAIWVKEVKTYCHLTLLPTSLLSFKIPIYSHFVLLLIVIIAFNLSLILFLIISIYVHSNTYLWSVQVWTSSLGIFFSLLFLFDIKQFFLLKFLYLFFIDVYYIFHIIYWFFFLFYSVLFTINRLYLPIFLKHFKELDEISVAYFGGTIKVSIKNKMKVTSKKLILLKRLHYVILVTLSLVTH